MEPGRPGLTVWIAPPARKIIIDGDEDAKERRPGQHHEHAPPDGSTSNQQLQRYPKHQTNCSGSKDEAHDF
jgi:hypothetical protein